MNRWTGLSSISVVALLLVVLAGSATCSEESAPEVAREIRGSTEALGARRGQWPFRRADGSCVLVDFDEQSMRELPVAPGVEVTGFAFDVSSGRIALLLADGEVQVLDTVSGERVSNFMTGEIVRGSAWVRRWVGFAAGGEMIVLAADAPAAEIWSVQTGTRLADLLLDGAGPATAIAVDASGERIALGDSAGNLGVWSVRDGRKLHAAAVASARITALAFDPAGEALAIGADDAVVRLWSLEGSDPTRVLSHQDADFFGDLAIGCVVFSPDGSQLVSASFPYWEARCWDVDGGGESWRYDGYRGGSASPLGATFSREGRLVVLSKRGVVLDSVSGQVLHELVGDGSISSDGETAWLQWSGCLHVFSVASGERLFEVDLERGSR